MKAPRCDRFTVQTGKGYVPAERNRPEDAPIGLISVDAVYSPVRRVAYRVEPTRQGQSLDYDKLINGSGNQRRRLAGGRGWPTPPASCKTSCRCSSAFEEPKKKLEAKLSRNCRSTRPVEEGRRSWNSRSARPNCLKNDNIVYIGDLIQKTEAEMLRTPNFGRKSLNEDQGSAREHGPASGMDVTKLAAGKTLKNWPRSSKTRSKLFWPVARRHRA